jgi:hypothetical protein
MRDDKSASGMERNWRSFHFMLYLVVSSCVQCKSFVVDDFPVAVVVESNRIESHAFGILVPNYFRALHKARVTYPVTSPRRQFWFAVCVGHLSEGKSISCNPINTVLSSNRYLIGGYNSFSVLGIKNTDLTPE